MKRLFVTFIIFLSMFSFLYSQTSKENSSDSSTTMTVEQAREMYTLLENLKGQKSLFPEEISAENLITLLNDKYTKNDVKVFKEDNELLIADCILIKVLDRPSLISFETFFENERNFSNEQVLKMLNDFNKITSIAFLFYSNNKIRLQYHMTYLGGIHSDNFNETISWFFDVASEFYRFMKNYEI